MSLNPRITDWAGRRVWIVGASSGIGRALALALQARGAQLCISARHEAALQSLAAEAPDRTLVLPMDASVAESWQTALERLQGHWDGLDQLIVCAGIYEPQRAWTLSAAVIHDVIATNLAGAMTGAAAVLPGMLARGRGAISLVASVAGYCGLPKALVYGPTKAGLINFCESLYLDVHDRGLAVHLIDPGFVATPLTAANDFRMPALISPETAADAILRGMARGDFEIHFPRRFTTWLKLLRHLPYRLQFALLAQVEDRT